ncbi:galactose/methyl galactoside ABC transporter permease MglC [Schleiferilactobacillus harbinensis]|uniref:Galactoside ABC transporter permease n=1 Tax=Schleiferilactobacillus harbinensis TaxID=304207 RepID=A0A5P8M471_9LACO|nr:galactoside ABC transporter permease [Schleiferilactobacillus harbinensis]QFR23269.1 galactoside ABC transporter permease [Schleiferilactobacillus harbinensis]
MADTNILTAEAEQQLRQPIDDAIGKIQDQINVLRQDGTDQVIILSGHIEATKRDKSLSKAEREAAIKADKEALVGARAVESQNKDQVAQLIGEAERYLKAHYRTDYYEYVVKSCAKEKVAAKKAYDEQLASLRADHKQALAELSDRAEIKEQNYVYKNKLFDAKMTYQARQRQIKDRQHAAFVYEYHLLDMLRMSKFSVQENIRQKWENYKYTFNRRDFLLRNGLYFAIIIIFIILAIMTPIIKGTSLLTYNNILNILQQASPQMFLALGVAGLILLTGTDLSIGRMVGMGMTAATIIMHQGINTGSVFGVIFDFSKMNLWVRVIFALAACIVLSTVFTTIAGFFTARFQMHPFISTMANTLIIFGLVTYATKGVSFGAIDPAIPNMIIPKIGGFPSIIIWAIAAIVITWFVWNKTRFGKNLYAVGGNPEAAAVSGISVFAVTLGAFVFAGILYGFGSWLECARMVGSGSAAYGQGWEMNAIAACVVGGVSFTGGIGKISGVVVGVTIFTALTYALTILGIDTNLQFVFSGIIILIAVTLDSLKYVQKK